MGTFLHMVFVEAWFVLPLLLLSLLLGFGAGRMPTRRGRSIGLSVLLLLPLAVLLFLAGSEMIGHNAAAAWALVLMVIPVALWCGLVALGFSIARRRASALTGG